MEMRAGLEVCLPTAYISKHVRPLVLLFALVYLCGKHYYLSIDSRSAESDFFNHKNERIYRFERSSYKLCTLQLRTCITTSNSRDCLDPQNKVFIFSLKNKNIQL